MSGPETQFNEASLQGILQSLESSGSLSAVPPSSLDSSHALNGFGVSTEQPVSQFASDLLAVVDEHIPRVRMLAENVLNGIAHAYEPGIDPVRTQEDYAALRASLAALKDLLRISGLGALPLLPSITTPISSEGKEEPLIDPPMITDLAHEEIAKNVGEVYEKIQREKENAVVALNILSPASGMGSTRR